MAIKINVDIPMLVPPELSPNRSRMVSQRAYSRVKRAIQEITYMAALEAKQEWEKKEGLKWQPFTDPILVNYTFYIANKRYIRDEDNAIAGMKHVLDILQSGASGYLIRAGLFINDRQVTIGKITWVVAKDAPPRIIVEIIGHRDE